MVLTGLGHIFAITPSTKLSWCWPGLGTYLHGYFPPCTQNKKSPICAVFFFLILLKMYKLVLYFLITQLYKMVGPPGSLKLRPKSDHPVDKHILDFPFAVACLGRPFCTFVQPVKEENKRLTPFGSKQKYIERIRTFFAFSALVPWSIQMSSQEWSSPHWQYQWGLQ